MPSYDRQMPYYLGVDLPARSHLVNHRRQDVRKGGGEREGLLWGRQVSPP